MSLPRDFKIGEKISVQHRPPNDKNGNPQGDWAEICLADTVNEARTSIDFSDISVDTVPDGTTAAAAERDELQAEVRTMCHEALAAREQEAGAKGGGVMVGLKPFFSFYGSKYRTAKKYPHPKHTTIIEPFAGSAGYSAYYHAHNVCLFDKDPCIVGVWDYLINASESDVLSLPDISGDQRVSDLDIPQEAQWLIGFWVNRGSTRPSQTRSAWMRAGNHDSSFWGKEIRERIASQLHCIRHWTVTLADYAGIENQEATWFIDPPYNNKAGSHYKMSSKHIDYENLSAWCQNRQGQVIVCENDGADWLPFRHFIDAKANESRNGGNVSRESIWTK